MFPVQMAMKRIAAHVADMLGKPRPNKNNKADTPE